METGRIAKLVLSIVSVLIVSLMVVFWDERQEIKNPGTNNVQLSQLGERDLVQGAVLLQGAQHFPQSTDTISEWIAGQRPLVSEPEKGQSYWMVWTIENDTDVTHWAVWPYGAVAEYISVKLYPMGNSNISLGQNDTLATSETTGAFINLDPPQAIETGLAGEFNFQFNYGGDVHLVPGQPYYLIASIDQPYIPSSLHMQIQEYSSFIQELTWLNVVITMLAGAGGVLALYNLCHYFTMRSSMYLFYSLAVVAVTLGWLSLLNVMTNLTGVKASWMFAAPFIVWAFLITQFAARFLAVGSNSPRLGYVMRYVSIAPLFVLPLVALNPLLGMSVAAALVVIFASFNIGVGIYRWRLGDGQARYFVSGLTVTLLVSGVSLMVAAGYLKNLDADMYVYGFAASILEALFVAFAMAEQVRKIKTENIELNRTIDDKVSQRVVELTRKKEVAEKAVKEKSLFLANMSHELRTPLNAIAGFSQLAMRVDIDPQQESYMNGIMQASKSLVRLVNNVLDMSKLEAGNIPLEQIDLSLNEIIERVLDIVSFEAQEKSLELILDIDADVPDQMIGDPLRIEQILLNLLSNAVKFTRHGHVRLSVSVGTRGNGLIALEFAVEDTGIGISQDQQQKLFRAFSQADETTARKFGGTGLGLAISRELCQMMNGDISIDSEIGKGATFRFNLVLGEVASRSMTVALETAKEHAVFEGMRALVVDKNPVSRRVLTRYLSEMNVTAMAADTGQSAMEIFKTLAQGEKAQKAFDVIFISENLEDIKGVQLAQLINDNHGECVRSVKMMTVIEQERHKKIQMASAKNYDWIRKPATRESLARLLKLQLNESPATPVHKITKPRLPDFATRRILLAEDNRINRDMMRAMFEGTNAEIHIARNGHDVLDHVEDYRYDLILMDVKMPGMDGVSAARLIRQQYSSDELPIVAMTAHAQAEDITESLEAGMNHHLIKPINEAQLFQTLGQCFARLNTEEVQKIG